MNNKPRRVPLDFPSRGLILKALYDLTAQNNAMLKILMVTQGMKGLTDAVKDTAFPKAFDEINGYINAFYRSSKSSS